MIALDRTRLIAGSGFSDLSIVCFQSSIFSRPFSVVHISMVALFEHQYVGCGDVRRIDDPLADIVEEASFEAKAGDSVSRSPFLWLR